MKLRKILVFVILASVVAGCASGPTPEELAQQEQIKKERIKAQEAEQAAKQAREAANIKQLKENWDKLQVGMSVDEVKQTLGPVCDGFDRAMSYGSAANSAKGGCLSYSKDSRENNEQYSYSSFDSDANSSEGCTFNFTYTYANGFKISLSFYNTKLTNFSFSEGK